MKRASPNLPRAKMRKINIAFDVDGTPPYHATSSSTAVCIGGIGTDQVMVSKASLDDMVIQTKEAKRAED